MTHWTRGCSKSQLVVEATAEDQDWHGPSRAQQKRLQDWWWYKHGTDTFDLSAEEEQQAAEAQQQAAAQTRISPSDAATNPGMSVCHFRSLHAYLDSSSFTHCLILTPYVFPFDYVCVQKNE